MPRCERASRRRRGRAAGAPGDVEAAVRAVVEHYERRGDGVLLLLAQEGSEPFAARVTGARPGLAPSLGDRAVFGPLLPPAPTREERRRPARRRHRCLHLEAAAARPRPLRGPHPGPDGRPVAPFSLPRPADPPPRTTRPGRHDPHRPKEPTMAEIVIVTWDGGGNVPPALAIARSSRRAATASACSATAASGRRSRRPGSRPCRSARHASSAPATPTRPARCSRRSATAGWVATCSTSWPAARPTWCSSTRLMLGRARRRPSRRACRYAVLEHFYDGYLQGALRGPLGLVLRLRGLRPGRSLADARVRVVTSLPELDPMAPAPTLYQVGPVVTWLAAGRRRPGGARQPQHLRLPRHGGGAAAGGRRLRRLPARVVVTTGPAGRPGRRWACPRASRCTVSCRTRS